MKYHHDQELDYKPSGLYNDRGDLMVCDTMNHKIHRCRCDGEWMGSLVISDDVQPRWLTGVGCHAQYMETDWENHQLVKIDGEGRVKKRQKYKTLTTDRVKIYNGSQTELLL